MKGILGLKSSYSMLKSMIPLEELILACKNYGYEFIALSDDQLHGSYDLFELSKKNQIKPIIGLEVDIIDPFETSFLVYAKDNEGYQNLLKLSKLKIINNNKLTFIDLVNHQKGLIVVSNGYNSIIDQTIIYGNEIAVNDYLIKFYNNFDDFYIGLSLNFDIQKTNLLNNLVNISSKLKMKLLPIHTTLYLNDNDIESYEALIKIDNQSNVLSNNSSFKLLSIDEINKTYSVDSIKDNLNEFLDKITFNLEIPKLHLPVYTNNTEVNNKEFLTSLAKIGLKRRLKINNIKDSKVYINRLEHELNTIIGMNFEDYFLIVYDFIKYAKDNKILVGPGRGSAAGSLVAYCLGITNVDPIKYDLLFERFLNPARTSMPDIDIDFPDNKRDFVIDYVRNKYGDNHICSISTFSSFQVRSSIRDIARVLNLPTNRIEGIIKSALSNDYDSTDIEVSKVISIASKIEGLYRQTGTHAAGIILSNEDLTKYIPMQNGSYSFNQSQYDANTLVKLGLNKIDFLGIRNLTIITDILNSLKDNNIILDLNNINYEDKKTFELLKKGDTSGIFQLESAGMRKVLEKLKPTNFEDIVATLALYRPGPMENIDIYIERRKGKKFEYLHKDLIPILNKTYGIIIYQEQIMQIAQTYAGYSLFEADMLRVGVSKKDINILNKERSKFVDSAVKIGRSKELSNSIYDYIVKFADYGFNRSHSVSYGIISYQMAYLKANYYLVFMKELLNTVIGNEHQTRLYIQELISNGYKVSAPNLNISSNKYIIIDNVIYMPLNSIKGFGVKTVNELIEEKDKKKFETFLDIKLRLSNILNETQFLNLIHSGSIDFLNYNRRTFIENATFKDVEALKYIKDIKLKEFEEYTFSENSSYEKDALSVNIKYDLKTLLDQTNPNKKKYLTVSNLNEKSNMNYLIGVINSVKEYKTKNNETMYFISITDGINNLDVTVFSSNAKRFENALNDRISIFLIKKNIYNDKISYVLENIANL